MLTASARWSNHQPAWVGISTSMEHQNYCIAEGIREVCIATCTYSSYVIAETTYYIWAKYSGESLNQITTSGFYITQNN